MRPLETVTSPVLPLPEENIDTDQIIPARFLTATDFDDLEPAAFADWRFDEHGDPRPGCILDRPDMRPRRILVAGHNFGCGSSREHAPRALLAFGLRVVISDRIADIFRSNALTCGLLAIEVGRAEQQWLLEHPDEPVTVNLRERYVELAGGHRCSFAIDPFARECLRAGVDKLGYLTSRLPRIQAFEENHP